MSFVLDKYTIDVALDTSSAIRSLKEFHSKVSKIAAKIPPIKAPSVSVPASSFPPASSYSPAKVPTTGSPTKSVGNRSAKKKSEIFNNPISVGSLSDIGKFGAIASLAHFMKDTVRASKDYNSALVGIEKTTNIAGAALQKLGKDLDGLSKSNKGLDVKGLREYAQAAGTMGIKGSENILKFALTMGKLEKSSDLAGQSGAQAVAKILAVTGTAVSEVDRLGAAIVYAGNNFETTEARVAQAAKRIAQGGAAFGITAADAVGLATAMDSLGVEAELGGSTFLRVMSEMEMGTEGFVNVIGIGADELSMMFKNSPMQAFQAFIKGLSDVEKAGGSVNMTLADLDLNQVGLKSTVSNLAKNYEKTAKAISGVSQAYKDNSALGDEFSKFSASSEASFIAMSQSVEKLKVTLGNSGILEAVTSMANGITTLLNTLSALPPEFYQLAGSLAIGFGAAKLFGKGLGLIGGAAALKKLGSLSFAFKGLAGMKGIGLAKFALKGFLGIFRLNPFGIAITGILALVQNWDKITGAINSAIDVAKNFFGLDGGDGTQIAVSAGSAAADQFGAVRQGPARVNPRGKSNQTNNVTQYIDASGKDAQEVGDLVASNTSEALAATGLLGN
ncbi:MAG: phage tail tape measure protein [Gammaproteobacteria bacterium]|nr:phage tail tape measure protein [Gammaproteobacteria bacterium]